MRRTGLLGLSFILLAAAGARDISPSHASESVSGRPRILSGDTLVVGGRIIGLYGVAAPSLKQTCLNAKGQNYACGASSAQALAAHLKDATVTCQIRETDSYGRALSVCHRDKEDLSAWMAEKGFAMAERGGKAAYVGAETVAWGKRLGLWAGSFEDPTGRPRTSYSKANTVADAQPETY
ncbi:thermonuclease family protein [Methylobacterium sp. R2-1]|uniref:thermonuclease family protein n=1 Tax=Methylobacterium sp. R2-1 TaxID=2587064 RepID=UPI00160F90B4|nr:thermonuclease family protein [Methylobacterium sp. R2-1]MBB2963720.1 endonuclease YncB(thermonuclease family) [Methylobacterium sp. R2-1]